LVRSSDRYAGGVAGGLAQLLDIDPIVVRVLLVVGSLYVPFVVVAYALAWLVLPDERTGATLLGGARTPDGWRPVAGIAALGIGLALVAPDLGPGGDGALTGGVLLAGIGVLLVLHHSGSESTEWPDPPAPPNPRTEPEPEPASTARRRPSVAPLERFVRQRLDERRRTRVPSYLGWLGLSALVAVVALVAAVDRAVVRVRPGVGVSLALLLIGGVLIVGAWRGRARLLIPVGLALVPLWIGWGLTYVPRYDHDGGESYFVGSRDELLRSYEHGFGRMVIDLQAVELRPGEHRTVHVGLTAGVVRLHVPSAPHLVVRGGVGLGRVWVREDPYFGIVAERNDIVAGDVDLRVGDAQPTCTEQFLYGPDAYDDLGNYIPPEVTGTQTVTPWGEPCKPEPPPEDPAVLEIVLDVGIGNVEVEREAA
jgi:phage shock protein PspC (stress-responsive transcriptional regulator)